MGRRTDYEPEPASFGARDIVTFLQRAGRPAFAEFVQHIDRRLTSSNVEIQEWIDHAASLMERLHKYEPPSQQEDGFSCKPPPEASD